jgi:bacillithiol biosynthesis cysteine-adding enzyme BshC
VDVRRFPWIRRFASDYVHEFPSVATFFSGDPASSRDWSRAIARSQSHARPRADVASILAAQQARRSAPPPSLEAGRRLSDPRTVAIVTGQQAGLFGGPMFTLLKAVTALKLARQITAAHDVPVVAVFWVEAEDHDWDEVRSCSVLNEKLEPCTVALPPHSGSDALPVAGVAIDASIDDVIAELEHALPATEFTTALLDQLRGTYAAGRGMADAFARWIEHVLGPQGLIVYDASDPAAKPPVADLFAREVSEGGQTGRLAAAAGADLASRGYHAQVQAAEDGLALFRLDGGRRPIRQHDGRFVAGEHTYLRDDLLQDVAARPADFSPSVLLRPLVQDSLFPTIAYVAGPNELAYLGQLRGVYDHFGVPMPLMYPRASATVLDSASLRFLTKYKLPFEALQPQNEAALNALLEAQIPAAVDASFAAMAGAIESGMRPLIDAVATIDPTLQGAAQSTQGRMQHDLQTLRGKMIQAAKRRDETLRRQFTRTRALAFPRGHAQERTIGFLSFLNQYGSALVDRLMDELPLDMGQHWVITI